MHSETLIQSPIPHQRSSTLTAARRLFSPKGWQKVAGGRAQRRPRWLAQEVSTLKGSHMWRFVALALAVITTLTPRILAQPSTITARAELSSNQVYVGDSIDLTIHVDGSATAERPRLNLPPNLQSEFAGGADRSQHSVLIINNKRQDTSSLGYSFHFRLTPARPGEYTIPPTEVTVDGTRCRTNPVTFTAIPAPQSDTSRLLLQADKSTLYVGEPTRLRITWLIASDVRGFRFSDLPGAGSFDFAHPRDRTPTGRQQQDQSVKEVPLFGSTAVATIDNHTVDGQQYLRVTIEQVITPKEPGSFEIGPMSVAFDQIVGRRQRDFFDSFFSDNAVTRRAVATSEPITLEVRPLPTDGKPADFSGLVGSYSLTTAAEPKDVGIGDPITLKLTINGPENLESISAPPLESTTGVANSFKLSPEGWTAASSVRGRTFTTTIRATNPSVSAIPSLELPYFDVESGRYSVARSDPIPLKVRPTRTVTAADAITSGAPAASGTPIVSSGTLESAAPGLPANYESYDTLVNEGAGLGDRLRSPIVIAALAAPAALYLALATTFAVRHIRHPHRPRLTQALRRARRHLARAQSPSSIADALRTYVGEVTHHQAITLTGDDCAALLDRTAPSARNAATSLGSLLSRCDAERFGGPEPQTASLRREALEALNALDRDLRRSA